MSDGLTDTILAQFRLESPWPNCAISRLGAAGTPFEGGPSPCLGPWLAGSCCRRCFRACASAVRPPAPLPASLPAPDRPQKSIHRGGASARGPGSWQTAWRRAWPPTLSPLAAWCCARQAWGEVLGRHVDVALRTRCMLAPHAPNGSGSVCAAAPATCRSRPALPACLPPPSLPCDCCSAVCLLHCSVQYCIFCNFILQRCIAGGRRCAPDC